MKLRTRVLEDNPFTALEANHPHDVRALLRLTPWFAASVTSGRRATQSSW